MAVTSHPDSGSDGHSASFDLLHEKVRQWIWRQGWDGLRDIQERAIPILLEGRHDLIVTAGTASGKTEAAFLPIVSRLASQGITQGDGFHAVYVSPMRALINDQFGRMESLCGELDIEVTKWHGDVSASAKAKARKRPGGVLLITPESMEAILVRRGSEVGRLFRALSYVVIDEMHAFMDSPRGKQLQSILYRIDIGASVQPVRIGLSATLADEALCQAFLRPLAPNSVMVLPRSGAGQELRLQVRGYVSPAHDFKARRQTVGEDDKQKDPGDPSEVAIVRHLFDTLRGGRNLIFAGARARVENVTVRLSELSIALGVPEEFFAHHGNLSREHREDAERRMKDASRPASIVCTTTLELGIDVGAIESVAQLGPGHAVSGMRQRLGRSGRRAGHPAVMRVYVQEEALSERSHPIDALRRESVQAVAMLNLMLAGWNDPPAPGRLHLSTMLHQVLALIAERGGMTPAQGWDLLVKSRVFEALDIDLYKRLLRRMGDPEVRLLEQAPDGTLLPGVEGERLIESRDIYAVFLTPEEYKVVAAGGRAIGQVPVDNPVVPGQFMVLAGRRWRVLEVDSSRKEILVAPAHGGLPPKFGGEPRPPSDAVVAEMRQVYETVAVPSFLDRAAITLLTEARTTFDRLGLRHSSIARHEDNLLLFPWVGERRQQALLLALVQAGLEPTPLGLAIAVAADREPALIVELRRLAASPPPDALELASFVEQKSIEKFDGYLGEDLLTLAFAHEHLDVEGLPAVAANIVGSLHGSASPN
jgi:ATP-dependent helicase Lhr and Lhr-like helicase